MISVLDQETIDFVKGYLDSFVVWDLLVYLVNFDKSEPLAASRLAKKLGREQEEVEAGLDSLTEKGVLERREAVPEATYVFVASPNAEEGIRSFVSALDVREKRLAILTILLGKENSISSAL